MPPSIDSSSAAVLHSRLDPQSLRLHVLQLLNLLYRYFSMFSFFKKKKLIKQTNLYLCLDCLVDWIRIEYNFTPFVFFLSLSTLHDLGLVMITTEKANLVSSSEQCSKS